MRFFSFYSGNNQPYTPRAKFSDKKFCTWDIICDKKKYGLSNLTS
jgi:hypothetical protein